MREIRTVALAGLGAIGCFYAPKLQKALGDGFYAVASGERADRIRAGITVNDQPYQFPVKDVASAPADLVLIAVKRPSLDAALADLAGHIGPGTIVLALLNGLDSENRVREVYPEAHVLYALVKSAVKRENGQVSFDEALGIMEFGEAENHTLSEEVLAVKELCERAELRYKIREDMILSLWLKYLSNMGENIACALIGAPIGALQRSEHAKALQFGGMREVVAVANAKGIALTEEDCQEIYKKTCLQTPSNKPSTLQDLEAGRKTEIEMFSGELVRLAAECGMRVPYNEVFYHAISALEEKNAGAFDA